MREQKENPPQPLQRWSGRQERFLVWYPFLCFFVYFIMLTQKTQEVVRDFAGLLK